GPCRGTDSGGRLLRPLLEQGRVHLAHRLERFEYGSGDRRGVRLEFRDQPARRADLLVAADGSHSVVNGLVGLNNKIKLQEWTLVQAGGGIDAATRAKLPRTLLDSGSVVALGGRKGSAFASVYDPQNEVGTETYTLFWSVQVPSSYGEKMVEQAGGDAAGLISLLSRYLRTSVGCNEALPSIMQAATQHLRVGRLTSSVEPETSWRDRDARNGRVILIGDAVHPMTPGQPLSPAFPFPSPSSPTTDSHH
ncbi:flavoprotein monooxygenase, partial [Teratosphaeria destructans]